MGSVGRNLSRRAMLVGLGALGWAGCRDRAKRSGAKASGASQQLTIVPVPVEVAPRFIENCYVLVDPNSRNAIVVDPGGAVDEIANVLRQAGATLSAVVATHGHFDHVLGASALLKRFPAKFAAHPSDRAWLERMPERAARFGVKAGPAPAIDMALEDGMELRLGDFAGRVLHTPGHSEGSCCLLFERESVLLSGDTLFAGSVGRTDLPGGSREKLGASIRDRLLVLDDAVRVLPGHNEETTLGRERRTNGFVRDISAT